MFITRSTQKQFSPYSITISVERPEDEEILKALSQQQFRIPEVLYPQDKIRHTRVQNFLNELMKELSK